MPPGGVFSLSAMYGPYQRVTRRRDQAPSFLDVVSQLPYTITTRVNNMGMCTDVLKLGLGPLESSVSMVSPKV